MIRLTTRALAVAALCLLAVPAHAGGMFFNGRGARALGRGGAFTAGADDGGALYYNPAGFADIDGISILVDGALVLQHPTYDRVDSGGNALPRVSGSVDILPIPTLAISWKPKRAPWFVLGGGVWTPYVGLNSWPEDGPQRYSAITLKGTLLAVIELAAAFRVRDWLWLGIGLQDLVIDFRSRLTLSGCSELNCAPEDRHFDALSELHTNSAFTPSALLGATFAFDHIRQSAHGLRIGIALQLPFFVRSSGTVHARLPTDPMYAKTTISGDAVDLDFNLPLELRTGLEWRLKRLLRLEVDVDYTAWSLQQNFTIRPRGIYLDNVPGIGRYYLPTLYLNRGLRDTVTVHLGAELTPLRWLALRVGWLLDTDATPDETATVLTPDALRNMISFGAGFTIPWGRRDDGTRHPGGLRVDLGYGHVFFADRNVTNSRSNQLNPIQPAILVPVGNGRYHIDADILSAGLEARF